MDEQNFVEEPSIFEILKIGSIDGLSKFMNNNAHALKGPQRLSFLVQNIIKYNQITLMNMMIYDFNFNVKYDNDIAVVWCSATDNIEMMQLLIDHGADVHTSKVSRLCTYVFNATGSYRSQDSVIDEFIGENYAFYNAIAN